MAKKPTPPAFKEHLFKKGISGNPSGRPKMSAEERRLVTLTKQEVARLLNMVAEMSTEEMSLAYADPDTKAIEKLFIKTILDGLDGDSVKAAEFILNRTIGKPKDDMQVTFLRRVVRKLDGSEIVYTNEPGESE